MLFIWVKLVATTTFCDGYNYLYATNEFYLEQCYIKLDNARPLFTAVYND
jgi:hypothetical protein